MPEEFAPLIDFGFGYIDVGPRLEVRQLVVGVLASAGYPDLVVGAIDEA